MEVRRLIRLLLNLLALLTPFSLTGVSSCI